MSQQMRGSKLKGRDLEERGILITEVRAGKLSSSEEIRRVLCWMAQTIIISPNGNLVSMTGYIISRAPVQNENAKPLFRNY